MDEPDDYAAREATEHAVMLAYPRLWAALVALTATEPLGYHEGVLPPDNGWGWWAECVYCGGEQPNNAPTPHPHDPACPWALARAVLTPPDPAGGGTGTG